MHPTRLAAVIAFAGLIAAASVAAAAEVTAITTPGKGDLTMCPESWMYRSCNLYHHIRVPRYIEVGGHVILHYGSNPKRYVFPVARIVQDGDGCTVFSQTGTTDEVENIAIATCRVAPPPP
jgi:hypothetical protein